MENKLEQLLNSLIERWWLPRWEDKIHSCRYYDEEKKFKADYTRAWIPQVLYRSIRELCSREAGLWQFVCENGMVKKEGGYRAKRRHLHWWEHDEDVYHDISYTKNNYEYYLLESSLKDESELEEFLLSNIKVDVESK